jgi:16S rRNA (cytosine1402-N4)-methyltransferase
MTTNNTYHIPVLVNEVLEYLNPQPNRTYLDVTFGGGGHTTAILEKEPTCKVIAMDWDKQALEKNAPPLQEKYGHRFKTIWGNFAQISKLLKKEKIEKVDGILADFGTSQFQIFHQAGFSFQQDSPLDMRMSQAHHYFKASDIVNRFTPKELEKIFRELGEERYARKIAHAIAEHRKREKFRTTKQLADLIESIIPQHRMKYRKHKIHPATKVFQALRIVVNKELENIEQFLKHAIQFLNIKGIIVCISFHSLEDRIVKNFFKEKKDELLILTKKPITATEKEISSNPSSRSAKLRAAEKTI